MSKKVDAFKFLDKFPITKAWILLFSIHELPVNCRTYSVP